MRFEKFPSIDQFRTVVKDVRYHAKGPTLPTLDFIGTVKLHGTNSGLYFKGDDISFQSRNRIITPGDDNLGFAAAMQQKLDNDLQYELLRGLAQFSGIDAFKLKDHTPIRFYGEWCGEGIQKSVGISEVEKLWAIFAVKVGDTWIHPDHFPPSMPEFRVYNVHDFFIRRLAIDFNKPELVQNDLVELTNEVEQECPAAKHFGVSGVGEGIVWSHYVPGGSDVYRFKVKGEKHSVTKVKKLAAVDVEKMKSVHEFAENTVTEARLQQAVEYLKENSLPLEIRSMGPFLKWLANDIFKEESDTMSASGLEKRDVGSAIAQRGKEWFMEKLNSSFAA